MKWFHVGRQGKNEIVPLCVLIGVSSDDMTVVVSSQSLTWLMAHSSISFLALACDSLSDPPPPVIPLSLYSDHDSLLLVPTPWNIFNDLCRCNRGRLGTNNSSAVLPYRILSVPLPVCVWKTQTKSIIIFGWKIKKKKTDLDRWRRPSWSEWPCGRYFPAGNSQRRRGLVLKLLRCSWGAVGPFRRFQRRKSCGKCPALPHRIPCHCKRSEKNKRKYFTRITRRMIEFFGNNNKNMNHLFCCWTVGKTLAVYQGRVYKQQEVEIGRPTVKGGEMFI